MAQSIHVDSPHVTIRRQYRDPNSFTPRRDKHKKLGLALSRANPACPMSRPYDWRKKGQNSPYMKFI